MHHRLKNKQTMLRYNKHKQVASEHSHKAENDSLLESMHWTKLCNVNLSHTETDMG